MEAANGNDMSRPGGSQNNKVQQTKARGARTASFRERAALHAAVHVRLEAPSQLTLVLSGRRGSEVEPLDQTDAAADGGRVAFRIALALLQAMIAGILGVVLGFLALPRWCDFAGSPLEQFIVDHPRVSFAPGLALVVGFVRWLAAGGVPFQKLSSARLVLLSLFTWLLFEVCHLEAVHSWLGESHLRPLRLYYPEAVMAAAALAVFVALTFGSADASGTAGRA